MTFDEATELLKTRFGTHTKAAQYLGITYEHYCALRNGRVPIPPRTAKYIIMKAQETSCPEAVPCAIPCGREAVSV